MTLVDLFQFIIRATESVRAINELRGHIGMFNKMNVLNPSGIRFWTWKKPWCCWLNWCVVLLMRCSCWALYIIRFRLSEANETITIDLITWQSLIFIVSNDFENCLNKLKSHWNLRQWPWMDCRTRVHYEIKLKREKMKKYDVN